jgi:Ca2+-binding RTX toxin-like protein
MSGHAAQKSHRNRLASPKSRQRRLRLENLEERSMLAVDLLNLTVTPSTINEGGTVTLSGQIAAPPQIAGLQLWLDASDTSSVVTDGSGNVQRWLDKSGLGNNAAPGTSLSGPAGSPKLNPTALNGHAAIRFDGIDDGLDIASSLNVARPYTIIIVDQYYGAIQGRTLVGRSGTNWLTGKWNGYNAHFAGGWVSANQAVVNFPTISTTMGNTTANSSAFYVNGSNLTGVAPTGVFGASGPGPSDSPGLLGIGRTGGQFNNNEPSQADVAEVLVYNRPLSLDERASVEKYLATKYSITYAEKFTGGDAGEGLDLDGNFVYAVNLQAPAGTTPAQGLIRSANFTTDAVPGLTVSAPNAINNWVAPDYGTSTNDNRLEAVMSSIRWNGAPGTVNIDAGNLVVGNRYKLQLLVAENQSSAGVGYKLRGYDVFVEGKLAYDNLSTTTNVTNSNTLIAGTMLAYEFVATDATMNLLLTPAGNAFGDNNPIINAFTLEDLTDTVPPVTTIGTYSGGDVGEGLDLDGTFAYAINVGGSPSPAIRNATFTADTATPGATVTAVNQITNFGNANFGSSPNDDALEPISSSIRWTPSPGDVAADLNVTSGTRYKLQMLFHDTGAGRGFDVSVENSIIADNFVPGQVQATGGALAQFGAVVTYVFTAHDGQLNIRLQNASSGVPMSFGDNNPILSGITLETLPPLPPAPPEIAHTVSVNWGDGTAASTLQIPVGIYSFSTTHTYADNPNGSPSGTFTPQVTLTNTAGETTTEGIPVLTGDPLIARPLNDGGVGLVFVMDEPLPSVGKVTSWSIYDATDNGQQVTPLIVEKVGANYVIRGVGTARTSSGSGLQTFNFGLASGSDTVGANYFLAWKDGSSVADNDGVIDYTDGGPDGIHYFAPGPPLNPGANIGAGTQLAREYSIQFSVDANASITVNDLPPTAAIPGSFTAPEGGSVVLAATATDPAGPNDSITFTWDLDGDGIFGEASTVHGSEIGATPTFLVNGLDGPGTFAIQVKATDEDGLTGAAASGSISITNVAPTAGFGGTFSVPEGGTVTLSATPGDPAGANDTVTYSWDLDNDGIFGEIGANATRGNETGASPVFKATGLEGPDTFPIKVRGTDEDGATGPVATGSVTITNAPPTVVITGPASTSPGFATSYTFTATDPSPVDQAGAFTFTIDWGDDNDPETISSPTSTLTTTHAYAEIRSTPYTITATATDKDGGVSADATFNVTVSPISVVDGSLVVGGTLGNDRISIQPSPNGYSVRFNNKVYPAPAFSGGIIVFGLDGADTITVTGIITVPMEFHGGEGNDYLAGGNGTDVLDGGEGADRLLGGAGADQLFGGDGPDTLSGGNGADELDGGNGNDSLQGDSHNDTLLGGAGVDRLVGGSGNDYADGGEDNDRLEGGDGNDLLLGQQGNDFLNGGAGRDVLLGGSDADTMKGGTGDDLLAGDTTDNDMDEVALAFIWSQWSGGGMGSRGSLSPNFDSSTIAANDGYDMLYGEAGNDWFLYFTGDNVRDFRSGDFKQLLT